VQKQFNLGFALPSLAVLLASLVTGCSASVATPAELNELSTTVESMPDNQAASGNTSTGFGGSRTGIDDSSCDEGTVEDCRTPIAARDGFYLCGAGVRSCHKNQWSSCTTHATSAGEDQWTSISNGCDAPPEHCGQEGESRDCVQYLPPSAPGENNCYHGKETCSAGAWSTCIQPSR
jgi:hypothetical protein